MLKYALQTLQEYTVLTDEARMTAALWAVYAHHFEKFPYAPILKITAPESACGKSTVFMTVRALVGLTSNSTTNMTAAALKRMANHKIVALDTFHDYGMRTPYYTILKLGYDKDTAVIGSCRTVKKGGYTPEAHNVFGPKIICGIIHNLPTGVENRCVTVYVKKSNKQVRQDYDKIQMPDTKHAIEPIPWPPQELAGLCSRQWDTWAPLLAVAESYNKLYPTEGYYALAVRACLAACANGKDAQLTEPKQRYR